MKWKALYYLVKFILNTLISFYFLIASWNSCRENCFWLSFPPDCRQNKSIDIGLEEFCFVAFRINYCAIFIKTKLTVIWITARGHSKGFWHNGWQQWWRKDRDPKGFTIWFDRRCHRHLSNVRYKWGHQTWLPWAGTCSSVFKILL